MNKLPFIKKKKVEGLYRLIQNSIQFLILYFNLEESRKIKSNDPTSNATKKYAVRLTPNDRI
jgi:hypothetical protein